MRKMDFFFFFHFQLQWGQWMKIPSLFCETWGYEDNICVIKLRFSNLSLATKIYLNRWEVENALNDWTVGVPSHHWCARILLVLFELEATWFPPSSQCYQTCVRRKLELLFETYKQEPRGFRSPFSTRGLLSTFGRAAACGTLVTLAPSAAVGHISSMDSMCLNHGLLCKLEHTCNPVSPFDLTWLCPGTCLAAVGHCGGNEVMLWTFLYAVCCMRNL